ncbi:MAG TPA: alkaline phosphatase D family protein [Gaiellaceae bacterium]|nr:alkaline phosphatase D family protein [Gaiellaceae bacterium]
MPDLVLGPLLRHVGENDATVWVETDGPCEVEVLGRTARTFHVAGHHYALVCVDGLEPGSATEYQVTRDGKPVWPLSGSEFPPSVIRTIGSDRPLELLFGSCRMARPHEPPYTALPDASQEGVGQDALRATTLRMRELPREAWPHAALLIGDQVYADDVSPETLRFIRSRRDTFEPPYEEVADFEEYTRLYRESWLEPSIRWFLSTVPTAMLFDDHDVHDDWNISQAWVERMRALPWWEDRIVGAFVSYWIYQHIGNLSPRELAEDELWARVQEADDASSILREFAHQADREANGTRWSFHRDFGRTRLLAIDCRAGRVLTHGDRALLDDDEWDWVVQAAQGDHDHLLLAMSDPFLLAPGIHHAQSWSEAVCDGAWGKVAAGLVENLREAGDLDHWAAFRRSFERLADLLVALGSGERGTPPASIVALSGDVHNAYLSEVGFRRGSDVRSRVYQAVCSPVRNPLKANERPAERFGSSKVGELIGKALSRSAGVPRPSIGWRTLEGPHFDNQIATLQIDGRSSLLRLERVGRDCELRTVFEHRLADKT